MFPQLRESAIVESHVVRDDTEPSPVFECPTCNGHMSMQPCAACVDGYHDGMCPRCDEYPPVGAHVEICGDDDLGWHVLDCGCSEVA